MLASLKGREMAWPMLTVVGKEVGKIQLKTGGVNNL